MYDHLLLEDIYLKNNVSQEVQDFRNSKLASFHEAMFPMWKRLNVDSSEIEAYKAFSNQRLIYKEQSGLTIKTNFDFDTKALIEKLNHAYGTSQKHRLLTETFSNTGTYIEIRNNTRVIDPIIIESKLDKNNPFCLDHHIIYAGQSSEVTVVIDYKDFNVDGYQNGIINIIAEKNAKVRVVKLQNFSKRTTHISSGVSILNRDASVSFSAIDIGGRTTVTDYSTYLLDENAKSYVDSIYLGDASMKLDLGYNIYHEGRRSVSDVVVKGALLDDCVKVFRGNLFFRKGAKRAAGAEKEFVILLDESVKSDSIPALMCDEDDVQGEHALSAGQVDENKLFYLLSRGLTPKEAKQLIIMASFSSVIDKLPTLEIRESMTQEISGRLKQN